MSNGPYNFIYLDIGVFGLFYDKKTLANTTVWYKKSLRPYTNSMVK